MRFHQLEIGAQFEFQGAYYTKSTNLIAVKQTDGTQKFMQRSAMVKPLGANTDPAKQKRTSGTVDIESVKQAHEKFYYTCMASIKNAPLDNKSLTKITDTVKVAHEQFLNVLAR